MYVRTYKYQLRDLQKNWLILLKIHLIFFLLLKINSNLSIQIDVLYQKLVLGNIYTSNTVKLRHSFHTEL